MNLEIDFVTYEVRSCSFKVTMCSSEVHKGLQRTNLEVDLYAITKFEQLTKEQTSSFLKQLLLLHLT